MRAASQLPCLKALVARRRGHEEKAFTEYRLTVGQELGMAKILQFKRMKKEVEELTKVDHKVDDIEGYVSAVIENYSLTVANRHWILENMLMDIDDQLEGYKKELEEAEKRLDTMVRLAEKEIEAAYCEFNAHVGGMTHAVKKLIIGSSRQSVPANNSAANTTDHQTNP